MRSATATNFDSRTSISGPDRRPLVLPLMLNHGNRLDRAANEADFLLNCFVSVADRKQSRVERRPVPEMETMATIGPHSRAHRFTNPDGRTRAAKNLVAIREELTAHVGGSPSVAQRFVIERAAVAAYRLMLLDRKLADGLEFSPTDAKTHLFLSNAIVRYMRELGLKSSVAKLPTLAETLHAERLAREQKLELAA